MYWSHVYISIVGTDDAANKSNGKLLKSYAVVDVTSALAVVFGLTTYIYRAHTREKRQRNYIEIYFLSLVALSLNCYIVRQPEIEVGLPLLNSKLENVLPGETSMVAARRGVNFTTATWAVLQIQMPTNFIPSLLLEYITPLKVYMLENTTMAVPITTFLLLISFGIGLPCAVGLFPQMSRIRAEDVEDKFGTLRYEEFYYSKGL